MYLFLCRVSASLNLSLFFSSRHEEETHDWAEQIITGVSSGRGGVNCHDATGSRQEAPKPLIVFKLLLAGPRRRRQETGNIRRLSRLGLASLTTGGGESFPSLTADFRCVSAAGVFSTVTHTQPNPVCRLSTKSPGSLKNHEP